MTPSSRATWPQRIARRLDFRETGHFVQASTSRSSLRWTLLSRPLMTDRSIVEYTAIHRENTSSPKPSVEMAIRLFHGNNRCMVQQSLQPFTQERHPRDGLCLGLPPPPMAAQAPLGAYETRLSRLMNSHILDSVPRDDDYAAGIFLKLKLKRLIELRLVG